MRREVQLTNLNFVRLCVPVGLGLGGDCLLKLESFLPTNPHESSLIFLAAYRSKKKGDPAVQKRCIG